MDEPFNKPERPEDAMVNLFYQRRDGAIRQATMLMNGTWLGAKESVLAASYAKNGTPIAVTSFTVHRANQTSITTVSKRDLLIKALILTVQCSVIYSMSIFMGP
jgi:hypothetical protein